MNGLSRRRFMCVSAAVLCSGAQSMAAVPVARWEGMAMGAQVQIWLEGLDDKSAQPVFADIQNLLARMEALFSLYRTDSALMRLNQEGRLENPAPEMLEILTLARGVHRLTAGAFDPSVQPLFALYAQHAVNGLDVSQEVLAAERAKIGFDRLVFDEKQVYFTRPDMALTLNGIAQGYVTDQIAQLLEMRHGLGDLLINAGEFRAIGAKEWPIKTPQRQKIYLKNEALAVSSTHGTVLDQAARIGHIFDPFTLVPSNNRRVAVVRHPSAAMADALSTAAVLMPLSKIEALEDVGARIEVWEQGDA